MRILVALKRSKWERDLNRFGSPAAVRRLYDIQNDAYERIFSSHERQLETIRAIRHAIPNATFVNREDLPNAAFRDFDCVVSIGGDNHFVYVSGFLPTGVPIVGINSDPLTSHGSLLHFSAASFVEGIHTGGRHIITEQWNRISCQIETLDGEKTHTHASTSEISVRNAFPDLISRYIIRLERVTLEEQKSSGLILATGAGSTGWYRNCHSMAEQNDVVFAKDAPFFRTIARELGATHRYQLRTAQVNEGEVLELVSEMDGQISIDTHPEFTFAFPPGATARFRLSDEPLLVVTGFGGE